MVWWMALAWAGVVDTAGPVALDDRMPVAERVEALQELGEAGEAEVLWVVRAASQVDVPEVQLAALDAAAAYDTAEAAAILGWVLSSPGGEVAVREHALELLSSHGTPHAADQLYAAAIDRLVAARWRSAATRSLEANYPDLLAQRGPPKQAVDPMGGLAFVAANGMVGGVALSSVGVWGQFDGAPAIGAVGGAAMGLGLSGLYVSKRPLTTGQGLAYASGASWGLAASAWTTSVVHGPWTYLERGTPRWQTAQDAGAAYRLAGVGLGAGVGALWMRSDPAPWDVLEVDLAGYLGSAVVMAATELVVWDGAPEPYDTETPYVYYTTGTTTGTTGRTATAWDDLWAERDEAQRLWEETHRQQGQIIAGATVAGAAAGLATGWALHDRWQLDAADAGFAATLGLEAAWAGNHLPDALGIDDSNLRGTVRLPWNAAVVGGLVLAEVHPMPWETTAVTAVSGLSFNAIGAGAAQLARADRQQVAQVMVPVGLVGTTLGVVSAPWLAPDRGDATMTAVGTAVAAAHGPFVGQFLLENDVLDDQQLGGAMQLVAGAAPPALLLAGKWADPQPDQQLVLGAAWSWGAAYGIATPFALRLEPTTGQATLAGAITGDVFLAAAGVAVSDAVGLRPRKTLVPQLCGVGGATVGALGVGLADNQVENVVLGGLVGSTVGLVGCGIGSAVVSSSPSRTARLGPVRLPGQWAPAWFAPQAGSTVPRFGVQAVGW